MWAILHSEYIRRNTVIGRDIEDLSSVDIVSVYSDVNDAMSALDTMYNMVPEVIGNTMQKDQCTHHKISDMQFQVQCEHDTYLSTHICCIKWVQSNAYVKQNK